MDGLAQPALIYCPHPLLPTAGRVCITEPIGNGESLHHYLRRIGLHHTGPVVLRLNDVVIARQAWAQTYPRSGDLITLRATVNGGGGGSNPLRTILSIAVLIIAPEFAPLLPMPIAIGEALLSVAGLMLVNQIAPMPSPKTGALQAPESSPTYAVTGGSNRARPYQPLPLLIGTHRILPDLGAQAYTEFHGADQVLFQVFNFGLADISLEDIRIGDTPISEYQGVQIEESGPDGRLTLFPGNVDTAPGAALTAQSGWVVRTGSLDATALAVELTGNLFYAGDRGIEARSVEILMQYRRVGDATWLTPVYSSDAAPIMQPGSGIIYHVTADVVIPSQEVGQGIRITNSSTKPVRRTYKWQVASGQYEVRVKRITPDSTESRLTSDISWSQLRTYQPDTADYTGQKRLALMITASGQLQGVVDQLSALGIARIPIWTGSGWSHGATDNPAWQFLWLARGKFDTSGRRLFGGGLEDSRLDIEVIKEWGLWCDAKGLSCALVFDAAMTVAEQLQIVARCGRAAPTWASGRLGVVYDRAAQPVVAVFGMGNIIRNTFAVEYHTAALADEIIVQFTNPNTWKFDTVRARVPGITNPVNPALVELFGCKDPVMAGREANLLAASHTHRVRTITWEADFEGLVVSRGDVVGLTHDLTQWGVGGRLVGGTQTAVMLDREVTFTPGLNHYVGIRLPDGTYNIHNVAYSLDATDTLVIDPPLPIAPGDDPDHPPYDYLWSFDPKATPGKKVKITNIRPVSDRRVVINATDETDDYYLAEYNDYTYIDRAPVGRLPTLSNLIITEQLVPAGLGYVVILTLTWDVTGEYGGAIVRAGRNGAAREHVAQTAERRAEFTTHPDGVLDIEVVGFNLRGQYGPGSRLETLHTLAGKTLLPPDVDTFLVRRQPDGTREFSWELLSPPLDLLGYQIRYQLGAASDWGSMTPMHKGVLTASPFESNQLAAGTYSFAIKAIDTSGLMSENARFITLTIGDPRLAGTLEYIDLMADGWSGTRTNCYVDSDGALVADDQATLNDLPDTWEQWTHWTVNPFGIIVYQHELDIGALATFVPLVSFVAEGAQTIEEQHSDDGVNWSAWVPVGPALTTRYFRARLTLVGSFPRVTIGTLILSADPIIDDLDDLNTSTLSGAQRIGTGDIRLPLNRDFSIIKRVDVVLQGVGAGWSWSLVDKDTAVGPRIQIFNAAGLAADAIIDATVKGV